jgi:hypothetical protein
VIRASKFTQESMEAVRTFRVPDPRHVKALFNAGYRRSGVIKSKVGTLYQFERSEAVRFCQAACNLGVYVEELT